MGASALALMLALGSLVAFPAPAHAAEIPGFANKVAVDVEGCTLKVTIDRDGYTVEDTVQVTIKAGDTTADQTVGTKTMQDFATGTPVELSLERFPEGSAINTVAVTVAQDGTNGHDETTVTKTLTGKTVNHNGQKAADPYNAGTLSGAVAPTYLAEGKAIYECQDCHAKYLVTEPKLASSNEIPQVTADFRSATPELKLVVPSDYNGDVTVKVGNTPQTISCDGRKAVYDINVTGTLADPVVVSVEAATSTDGKYNLTAATFELSPKRKTSATMDARKNETTQRLADSNESDALLIQLHEMYNKDFSKPVAVDLDGDGKNDVEIQVFSDPSDAKVVVKRLNPDLKGTQKIKFNDDAINTARTRYGIYFEEFVIELPATAGAAKAAETTTGVATGDESNMLLYGALMLLGGSLAIGVKVKKEWF